MTGFGKHIIDNDNVRINIEIKSLNSKMLDINCRLPLNYKEYEIDIRNLLSTQLERGKVDCSISSELKTSTNASVVNQSLAEHYYKQFKTISDKFGIDSKDDFLSNILKMPDIFLTPEAEIDENEWKQLSEGILFATDALNEFRAQEGKTLEADLKYRIGEISALLEKVEPFEKERADRVKERIRINLSQTLQ